MMRRLLIPSLYNLACDGLLPSRIAIVGVAREAMTTAEFRERHERRGPPLHDAQ